MASAKLVGTEVTHLWALSDGPRYVGCNTMAVACYAAAGFTFGTVIAAPATPAVILACNVALGTCVISPLILILRLHACTDAPLPALLWLFSLRLREEYEYL